MGNECDVTSPSQNAFVTWEGKTINCKFPTEVTFAVLINQCSQNNAVGQLFWVSRTTSGFALLSLII